MHLPRQLWTAQQVLAKAATIRPWVLPPQGYHPMRHLAQRLAWLSGVTWTAKVIECEHYAPTRRSARGSVERDRKTFDAARLLGYPVLPEPHRANRPHLQDRLPIAWVHAKEPVEQMPLALQTFPKGCQDFAVVVCGSMLPQRVTHAIRVWVYVLTGGYNFAAQIEMAARTSSYRGPWVPVKRHLHVRRWREESR